MIDCNQYMVDYADKDGICLDIGCNVGTYLERMSARFKRVYAFDPHPRSAECAKFLVKHKGLHNVEVFQLGFSNFTGMTKLYFAEPGGHTIREDIINKGYGHKEDKFAMVPIIQLDDLDLTGVTACKIDVEANEEFLIKGAKDTLRRNQMLISIETHGHVEYEKLYTMFAEADYKVWKDGQITKHMQVDTPYLACNYLGDTLPQ